MLATARMVERYTGIPESALASSTEHFTSSPDGYFYCMMEGPRGEFNRGITDWGLPHERLT